MATHRLVLLRHGESEWNKLNLFTGWWDADLTERGAAQAVEAGRLMQEHDVRPAVVHTPLQTRAIRTVHLAPHGMRPSWLPGRPGWRPPHPHSRGPLGRNKAQPKEAH